MPEVVYNNQEPPVNNQDAFDRACERLLVHFDLGRSNPFALNRGGGSTCVYRLPSPDDKTKIINCCVVGYMLPDFEGIMPAGEFNEASAYDLVAGDSDARAWFANVSEALLSQLQRIHDAEDNWVSRSQMYLMLDMFARTNGYMKITMSPKFEAYR